MSSLLKAVCFTKRSQQTLISFVSTNEVGFKGKFKLRFSQSNFQIVHFLTGLEPWQRVWQTYNLTRVCANGRQGLKKAVL